MLLALRCPKLSAKGILRTMTGFRWRRVTAFSMLLLLLLFSNSALARKKKRRSSRRRAAPAAPIDTASGTTLQERLASLLNGSVARSSLASVQVVEVESGTVIAERNPHQPLAPASNMKLFTTAAAIDMLHPEFAITTTVFARGTIQPNGTLEGDIKIVGHGDPTIGGRFHDNHATAVQDEWATDLKRAGIKTVHGNLISEYGYMDTQYIHPT